VNVGGDANKARPSIIGVGGRTNPRHGKREIYLDDIAVGQPVEQQGMAIQCACVPCRMRRQGDWKVVNAARVMFVFEGV
jgi:hypothetical protein